MLAAGAGQHKAKSTSLPGREIERNAHLGLRRPSLQRRQGAGSEAAAGHATKVIQ
jgi:hypothetical protein